jgi:IS30 family transposase
MASTRAWGFSASQKVELWQRWKDGQSLVDIGRALGKGPSSIFQVVAPRGGIGPATRRRSARALRAAEREEISRGIAGGLSMHKIAATIGRPVSTVSREIARNGGRERYRAAQADAQTWERARRPKACRLATRPALQRAVARKLQQDWAPRQISGWLKRRFPYDEGMHVSHETIYRTLFVQARGALKKELMGHLRRVNLMRRPRKASTAQSTQGAIVDALSIRQRPAEAEDRAVPGHWEGDLLMGGNSTQIATLVERSSRFVMLVKLDSKGSVNVAGALAKKIGKLPAELKRSLTWDRGTEMAAHKQFTVDTNVKVYFCDPRSPWQRGSNENTNGLLRQYFPKGDDLSVYSQSDLNKVALRLNTRPRETLQFATPAETLQGSVASTG